MKRKVRKKYRKSLKAFFITVIIGVFIVLSIIGIDRIYHRYTYETFVVEKREHIVTVMSLVEGNPKFSLIDDNNEFKPCDTIYLTFHDNYTNDTKEDDYIVACRKK